MKITPETAYRNNPSDYMRSEIADGRFAELGDHFWYEYSRGLVIPVTVVELDEIVSPTPAVAEKYGLNPTASLWVSIEDGSISGRPAGVHVVGSHLTEKEAGDWPRFVPVDPVDLKDCTWHTQEFWLDEVIGHAVQIDDLFLSPDDALRQAYPLDKRQAHRRHKKLQAARRRSAGWLTQQHVRAGGEACPVVTTPKKVYAKVGRMRIRF